jgi:hypothetical protein
VDPIRPVGNLVVKAKTDMIVTIVAYKRPELLARLLESVMQADLTHVECISISCDRHSDEMYQKMCKVCEDVFWRHQNVPTYRHWRAVWREQVVRLGIHNHQRWLYNTALGMQICALEEDCVVSPDIFNMAHWALQQPGYKFVNLARPVNWPVELSLQRIADMPSAERLHEDHEFRSSYAWAFTRDFWRELEPQWNGKMRQPYGWDWQINYLCYREGWKCLTPEVARAYETPDIRDANRAGATICQTVPHLYSVVSSQTSRESVELPGWVVEEMKA